MERTLVLIKPDGVQRALIGEVIQRLERRGLRLAGMKFMRVDRGLAERHYGEHKGKPFYEGLLAHITSAPVVAMVWEGGGAIQIMRDMMGKTRPDESPPGTIRGDFAIDLERNVVHGSADAESAAREVSLFFKSEELIAWERDTDPWIFSA